MNIAVVPARGGSKRLPRKNIREFLGKPLIAHPIGVARESGLFERVIVSTDDTEIANIAIEYGAEVPFFRPDDLSDDYTGTTDVVAHAVRWLQSSGASSLFGVCCIYPTAPFIRVEDLAAGLALLKTGDWQYVFSATTYASSIFRSFYTQPAGGVAMHFPEQFEARSQDLPEAFHDAGQFYWGKAEAWLDRKRIFDRYSSIVRIPRWRVVDIDTEEDWCRAELMSSYIVV